MTDHDAPHPGSTPAAFATLRRECTKVATLMLNDFAATMVTIWEFWVIGSE